MRLIGISGRKQAGKNTVANYLHGIIMNQQDLVQDYRLNQDGELEVFAHASERQEEVNWYDFDLNRIDSDFVSYAENQVWPHVKLYSFADSLKAICMNLFDIPRANLYGTDKEKSTPIEHLLWQNMPGVTSVRRRGPMPEGLIYHTNGEMSAREFMQFFGTEVMRKIYGPVWVKDTINRVVSEGSSVPIIADVRFPDEADAILEAGGEVWRLTRNPLEDDHISETALDDYMNFTTVLDNADCSIAELEKMVKKTFMG